MVTEIHPAAFLDSFKGLVVTSKSVTLATTNIYTFKVDKHLDKALIKAMLEYILEAPVVKLTTRPVYRQSRPKGQFRKKSYQTQLKHVQIMLKNKLGLPEWMSY